MTRRKSRKFEIATYAIESNLLGRLADPAMENGAEMFYKQTMNPCAMKSWKYALSRKLGFLQQIVEINDYL